MDEQLRILERAALSGDPSAVVRLIRHRHRLEPGPRVWWITPSRTKQSRADSRLHLWSAKGSCNRLREAWAVPALAKSYLQVRFRDPDWDAQHRTSRLCKLCRSRVERVDALETIRWPHQVLREGHLVTAYLDAGYDPTRILAPRPAGLEPGLRVVVRDGWHGTLLGPVPGHRDKWRVATSGGAVRHISSTQLTPEVS